MHMKIRGFIIVGILLCIASAGLCGFAATRDDFVLEEVYTDPNLERKEYELEEIHAISFKGAAEDLEIIYTEDQSKIIYYDGKYKNYNIQVESGVLTINQEYKNHFFHFNFFTYISNKCTIYINSSLEDLYIQ
ncbi:MAG: hypothetical protein K2I42_00340, partial [Anaeroplasmataceae bacterium]|nr:hypothetical protein [Anaeroplasmataceae bacterium]